MKNLWIAALAAVLLVSCGGRESQNRNKQTTKTEKKMGVRHLTKAEFLTKVANYEASPKEWKFLGDKPWYRRFLCELVPAVQDDRADSGKNWRKSMTGSRHLQGRYRERAGTGGRFRHPFDSHAAVLSDGRTASGRSGSDEQGRF